MLKTENLAITYPDGTNVIRNLSCRIRDGETVALIGANGAGKTSLLLSLVGVLAASEGTILIDGNMLGAKTMNDIRRRVALVFQNPDDQLFMPDIYEDIAFGPRNFGMGEAEVAAIVDGVLDRLNIAHLRHRSPLKLSGGEKRTAAIATVLAMNPTLMLFDEPTAFLDPKSRRNLITLLNRLTQTKLIATHDLSFAAEVCDRIMVLKDGMLFAEGTVALLHDTGLMAECDMEALPPR